MIAISAHMIIADIAMPVMDGFTFSKQCSHSDWLTVDLSS
jgi:CheY-like chemotaxis protein